MHIEESSKIDTPWISLKRVFGDCSADDEYNNANILLSKREISIVDDEYNKARILLSKRTIPIIENGI